jgi:hypothetical protein
MQGWLNQRMYLLSNLRKRSKGEYHLGTIGRLQRIGRALFRPSGRDGTRGIVRAPRGDFERCWGIFAAHREHALVGSDEAADKCFEAQGNPCRSRVQDGA